MKVPFAGGKSDFFWTRKLSICEGFGAFWVRVSYRAVGLDVAIRLLYVILMAKLRGRPGR